MEEQLPNTESYPMLMSFPGIQRPSTNSSPATGSEQLAIWESPPRIKGAPGTHRDFTKVPSEGREQGDNFVVEPRVIVSPLAHTVVTWKPAEASKQGVVTVSLPAMDGEPPAQAMIVYLLSGTGEH